MQNGRLELEQLKAMDDEELYGLWEQAAFPFDTASCSYCLTAHAELRGDCETGCFLPEHQTLIQQVAALAEPGRDGPSIYTLSKHLEELYALRLFFDSLYPQTEPATPPPQPEQEMERVR